METFINVLKILGYATLVLEAVLVLFIVVLSVDYVLENRKESKTRVSKHRAVQETVLERAKRELREAKEKAARENAFFNEYFINGFYSTGAQARRDNKIMAVFTAEEI